MILVFFLSRYYQMKFGVISIYAMYLVLRLILNIVIAWLYIAKKVSADTMTTVTLVESLISLVFTVLIFRIAIKSGGKA